MSGEIKSISNSSGLGNTTCHYSRTNNPGSKPSLSSIVLGISITRAADQCKDTAELEVKIKKPGVSGVWLFASKATTGLLGACSPSQVANRGKCSFTVPVDSNGMYNFKLSALHEKDFKGLPELPDRVALCGDSKDETGMGRPPIFVNYGARNLSVPMARPIKDPSKISRSKNFVTIAARAIEGIGAYEPTYWACLAPSKYPGEAPGECSTFTYTQIKPDFSSGTPPYVPTAATEIAIPREMQGVPILLKVGTLTKINKPWCYGGVTLNP